ncbi:hypothetical protein G6F56_003530 [Rhizopus delemar]|nr:hypothetical protein G6F56_003530 [Rhizopus delemar]
MSSFQITSNSEHRVAPTYSEIIVTIEFDNQDEYKSWVENVVRKHSTCPDNRGIYFQSITDEEQNALHVASMIEAVSNMKKLILKDIDTVCQSKDHKKIEAQLQLMKDFNSLSEKLHTAHQAYPARQK